MRTPCRRPSRPPQLPDARGPHPRLPLRPQFRSGPLAARQPEVHVPRRPPEVRGHREGDLCGVRRHGR
ncbi:MAG: hypothetical protein EBX95_15175, partial [Acidimicrobiia bacterium]|nr:hypothetical protein [Acidimicrobiia bacterium]